MSTPVALRVEARHARSGRLTLMPASITRLIAWCSPLVFALPYLVIVFALPQNGFASSEHSHAILDGLLARRAGALDQLGQHASPLIAWLAYLIPSLNALRTLAALAAGASVWIVWRQFSEIPVPAFLRALLLAAFATTPAILFLGYARASEMITLLLLLVSWRLYLRFVQFAVTWSGFAAGLVLALAFFSDFRSIAYVVPFAIAAPRTLFRGVRISDDDRFRAAVTGVLVIALPALIALLAWSYVTWIVNGSPFAFGNASGNDPAAASQEFLFTGSQRALEAFAGDMTRVPLYPIVGLLMLLRSRRTLVAYVFPVVLTTALRLMGDADSEAFTLGTYLAFSLVGVSAVFARWPRRFRRSRNSRISRSTSVVCLVVAALVQLGANAHYSLRSAEPAAWNRSLLQGHPDATEQQSDHMGALLAALPDHSVLADDNAYKIIARHHTVGPYILPSDARFELVRSAPAEWVDHILVNTEPTAYDHLSQNFSGEVPDFYVDVQWPGWRLLTRTGATPLADR
jgi:hypothetical protein